MGRCSEGVQGFVQCEQTLCIETSTSVSLSDVELQTGYMDRLLLVLRFFPAVECPKDVKRLFTLTTVRD